MAQILRYEIKKIFKRPLTKVVVVAAFFMLFMSVNAPAWDDFQDVWGPEHYGSYEEIPQKILNRAHENYNMTGIYDGIVVFNGKSAIEQKRRDEKALEGLWDDAFLQKVASEYSSYKQNPDNYTDVIDSMYTQYRHWTLVSQGMSEAEVAAYNDANPIYIMKPEVRYSQKGRELFFIEQFEDYLFNADGSAKSFKEAFPLVGEYANYEYHAGIKNAINLQAGMVGIYILFVLIALLAPVFSEEISCNTEPMLLASKYGRDKLIRAKITSAMLVAGAGLVIMAVLNILMHGFYYGFSGMGVPVQLDPYMTDFPYKLTYGQYFLVVTAVQLVGVFAFSGVVILASSFLRSAIPVVFGGAVLTFVNILGTRASVPAVRYLAESLPVGVSVPVSIIQEGKEQGWGFLPISQLAVGLILCAAILAVVIVIIIKKYKAPARQ